MYSGFGERHHHPADQLDCQRVCFLSHLLESASHFAPPDHWVHHLLSEDSLTSSLLSTPAQAGWCMCHACSRRSKCMLPMTGLLPPCFNGFCTCEGAISYHIKLGNVYGTRITVGDIAANKAEKDHVQASCILVRTDRELRLSSQPHHHHCQFEDEIKLRPITYFKLLWELLNLYHVRKHCE